MDSSIFITTSLGIIDCESDYCWNNDLSGSYYVRKMLVLESKDPVT